MACGCTIRNAHNAVFFQQNLSSMSFQYKMSSILLCVLDSIELRLNYDIYSFVRKIQLILLGILLEELEFDSSFLYIYSESNHYIKKKTTIFMIV
jgi:hypothetical protein